MNLLLLVNSSASSVTARARVVIQKALSADHDVALAETSRRGHATRLARDAAGRGTDVVVVLGGDGTLNEAANGLAGSACALAPLPGGSTNVFARTLGLPNDPIEATGVLLDALARRSVRSIGLGSVDGRSFLFNVGLGYDAAVVAGVERRDSMKRWAGHPLFVWSAVETWARGYDRKRPRFAVHLDEGEIVDDAVFALFLNANPYTYLGNRPLDLAPDASLDRPLAALVFRTLDAIPLLTMLGSALGSGAALRRSRSVVYRPDQRRVRVDGFGPFPYQVDGDYLGQTEGVSLRWDADSLRLVVP